MTIKEAEPGQELLAKAAEYLPAKGLSLVREALEFASECHQGQVRKSGDPVITHPLHAAATIASLQLDAAAGRQHPGGEPAEDVPGNGPGPACGHHQAGGPAA